MFEFVIPACPVPALQHDGAEPAQFRTCGRQGNGNQGEGIMGSCFSRND